VVHAHPATVDDRQMLTRWAAATATKPHLSQEITEEVLRDLRDLAVEHVRRLNDVRLTSHSGSP
jgi:hypothetical protein